MTDNRSVIIVLNVTNLCFVIGYFINLTINVITYVSL